MRDARAGGEWIFVLTGESSDSLGDYAAAIHS
jgi:hypothetical protein